MKSFVKKLFLRNKKERIFNDGILIIYGASSLTQGSTGNLPEISWRFRTNSSTDATNTFFKLPQSDNDYSLSDIALKTKIAHETSANNKVPSLLTWLPYIAPEAQFAFSACILANISYRQSFNSLDTREDEEQQQNLEVEWSTLSL